MTTRLEISAIRSSGACGSDWEALLEGLGIDDYSELDHGHVTVTLGDVAVHCSRRSAALGVSHALSAASLFHGDTEKAAIVEFARRCVSRSASAAARTTDREAAEHARVARVWFDRCRFTKRPEERASRAATVASASAATSCRVAFRMTAEQDRLTAEVAREAAFQAERRAQVADIAELFGSN